MILRDKEDNYIGKNKKRKSIGRGMSRRWLTSRNA